ncbi:DNA repair and recombination protein [Physcia stellaris]|nr:DNA repair and recombination protein [Physcia stellaris]
MVEEVPQVRQYATPGIESTQNRTALKRSVQKTAAVPKFASFKSKQPLLEDNKSTDDSEWRSSEGFRGQDHITGDAVDTTYGASVKKHRATTNQNSAIAAAYVPLRPAKARNTTQGERGYRVKSPSSDDQRQRHRSLHGRLGNDGNSSYGSESSTSDYEDDWPQSAAESPQNKRVELLKIVENDPSNCDAWLKLIDYQDVLIRMGSGSQNLALTRAERQSNAAVKISMYEKALSKAVTMESKETLVIGMMEEGSTIWDSKTLSSKWQGALQTLPGSSRLWTKYLDFRQTDFSNFRYEETRASYIECFLLLRNAEKLPKLTATERYNIQAIYVHVVLRLTLFSREAGYPERAVATWQALLEYEIYRPSSFLTQRMASENDHEKALLTSFEIFWESEVPRIGDDGALGWASFEAGSGAPPQPTIDANTSLASKPDKFGSWANLERQRALDSRVSARTIDDVEENDPYRIVLFSDVRDVLENYPTSLLDRSLLIAGWLAFCHLPPWTRDGESQGTMVLDSAKQFEAHRDTSKVYDHSGAEAAHRIFQVSPIDHELSSETLFSTKRDWISAFGTLPHRYTMDNGPVKVGLLGRTLSALVEAGLGNDTLAEYLLALELQLSPDTVRRIAKKLIKNRPESLRLYNAYACIEYQTMNENRAQNVIVSAINNSRNLGESSQDDAIFLWRTWVWGTLGCRRPKEALERLLAYPDQQVHDNRSAHEMDVDEGLRVRPAVLLRARQALSASLDHFFSLARPVHSFIACDLLIILTYLSNSVSLSSALEAFTASLASLSSYFPSDSPAHELLHQSFAQLLYHHANHVPLFKPATIRETLTASVALFPHNTVLLSVYAWNETRFRVDDRVRTIINDVVLGSTMGDRRKEDKESVIPHYFSLHTELNRSLIAGSNSNTVRNTFEKAISDTAGAHCVGLWKSYVLFEMEEGDLKRARSVWWRGVQACPWAKELWMMGFQELRVGMRDEELKGLYGMMVEKELRMHVDLIELLETNP